jgi:phytoene dehydrogenase-like protein
VPLDLMGDDVRLGGHYDAVVVGAGHNGLVAAAYLAGAGLSVAVLEASDTLGGATQSTRAFPGVDARLSRYSYLVSLLPDRIVADLGLRFTTRGRAVSSYTPVQVGARHTGLLVPRDPADPAGVSSFTEVCGDDRQWRAWQGFHARCSAFARAVAPSLLEPLVHRDQLRRRVDPEVWRDLVDTPIADTVRAAFTHDVVRGVVLTDALIGTFSDGTDLAANRCFWYHVVGNGTGEWRVPVGGMGALVGELVRVATAAGVELHRRAPVGRVSTDGSRAEVELVDGRRVGARWVLSTAAPAVLARLLGEPGPPDGEGCQMKLNLVLRRLPRLRSGLDPAVAFAGTVHVDEADSQLVAAHTAARSGVVPDPAPADVYCHSLTDDSILGPDLRARGWHTLTLFGLHTPAALFDRDPAARRDELVARYLDGLDRFLVDPIEDCLAADADGRPCLEAATPLDLEAALRLPRGHIFHRPLQDPFTDDPDQVGLWGVETGHPNVMLCGAGARRGGGVSGIPGHNAARAVLERVRTGGAGV